MAFLQQLVVVFATIHFSALCPPELLSTHHLKEVHPMLVDHDLVEELLLLVVFEDFLVQEV